MATKFISKCRFILQQSSKWFAKDYRVLGTSSKFGMETEIQEGYTGDSLLPKRPPLPIMTSRVLQYPTNFTKPRQAWVENLDTVEDTKLGIIDLHPDIFAAFPRIDFIRRNVQWQTAYRRINRDWAPTRAEMRGGGRKPWRQKGLGKARHGSVRSPLWIRGGKAHGPRGPKTYYYMLPTIIRAKGLMSMLSIKLAQDDLHIVDSFDIPSDDPKFLENLAEHRHWGLSVLFIDENDIMPRNITAATDKIPHFNLMPVYGLNIYSMLKHETLVLTLAAVEKIEERLLFHLHKLDVGRPKDYLLKLQDEMLE